MVRIADYLNKLRDEVILDSNIHSEDNLPKTIRKADPRTVLFERPLDDKDPLIANLYSTREKVERLMGIDRGRLFEQMVNAKKRLVRPIEKTGGWVENSSKPDRISKIPILKYYEEDAGKYITSSIIVAKDPEDGVVNMSVHRLLYLGSNRFAVRMVEGRHLHQIFVKHKNMGVDLKVAVLIGTPVHVILSASTQLPKEVSEIEYAGALNNKPLEVSYFDGSDIPVPLESEYVFESRIRIDVTAREWMTDILCLPDKPRDQPIMEVDRVYFSVNPIYHAILPGGLEHKFLMGYPAEVKIREKLVENDIEVKDVWLSSGSGGWLHCFVSILKKSDDEPRRVISLVMEAHRSVKGVIVVDDDIDPRSYEDVDFALATRFQEKEKFYFFEKVRGSSLDPSSDQEKLLTSKWGLDLTLPIGIDRKRFLRSKM
ncbi:MAG: UbiD family decarboxylase [Thermoproteota archaeon]|nr:UbiD family decarboxylase [Candidatus Brockarchaeota archaeon]